MRFSLPLMLAVAVAFIGPSHADDRPGGEGRVDVVNVEICGTDKRLYLGRGGRAGPAGCEPLPVVIDLRFLDDDYSSENYGLPVALNLDWESGEP